MKFSDLHDVMVDEFAQPVQLFDLINDWASRVVLLRAESSAKDALGDHWGVYDLANSYVIRDIIEAHILRIASDGTAADGAIPVIAAIDELLRTFTYEEDVAFDWYAIEPAAVTDNWWWARIPISGAARDEYNELLNRGATGRP